MKSVPICPVVPFPLPLAERTGDNVRCLSAYQSLLVSNLPQPHTSKSALTSWSFTPPATHPPFSSIHATSPAVPTPALVHIHLLLSALPSQCAPFSVSCRLAISTTLPHSPGSLALVMSALLSFLSVLDSSRHLWIFSLLCLHEKPPPKIGVVTSAVPLLYPLTYMLCVHILT